MVDLRVSNLKLRARGHRLIRTVCKNATLTEEYLDRLIAACDGSVKLAIVVVHNQWTVEKGRTALALAGGRLDDVLSAMSPSAVSLKDAETYVIPLFLCIDGGGTSTRAIITTVGNEGQPSVIAKGFAGPSNVSTVGVPAALNSVNMAIQNAVSTLGPAYSTSSRFSGAWIGCAGIDTIGRPSSASEFTHSVSDALSVDTASLRVTSDAALLGAIISPGIVLISGTGSIAIRFDSSGTQVARAGGLGYLLGDEGSGYDVGRLAIRHALSTPGTLRDAVLGHFQVDTPEDLVNAVYSTAVSDQMPKERVSGVAPIVLNLAFGQPADESSVKILHNAVAALLNLFVQVMDVSSAASSIHIASTGGLLNNDAFRLLLQQAVEDAGYLLQGGEITHVHDPAEQIALLLARRSRLRD